MATKKEKGLCGKHGCQEKAAIAIYPQRHHNFPPNLLCAGHWQAGRGKRKSMAEIVASGQYNFDYEFIEN